MVDTGLSEAAREAGVEGTELRKRDERPSPFLAVAPRARQPGSTGSPLLHVLCSLGLLGVLLASRPALGQEDAQPVFPRGSDATLPGLVDVGATLPVKVELKYATPDNFMHRDVYGGLKRCFLVPDAARLLAAAHKLLATRAPGLTFVMYDCARPRRVQLTMWKIVEGTKAQGYVANPHKPPGSIHNTGCAVDLSLADATTGAPVDMGTPFDFFGRKAEPRAEVQLWLDKQLTGEQLANRLLLREVMLRAGFRILPHEWWHFDCAEGSVARKQYAVID
jgi:D-alanyl-D-alanine dipeptidase